MTCAHQSHMGVFQQLEFKYLVVTPEWIATWQIHRIVVILDNIVTSLWSFVTLSWSSWTLSEKLEKVSLPEVVCQCFLWPMRRLVLILFSKLNDSRLWDSSEEQNNNKMVSWNLVSKAFVEICVVLCTCVL